MPVDKEKCEKALALLARVDSDVEEKNIKPKVGRPSKKFVVVCQDEEIELNAEEHKYCITQIKNNTVPQVAMTPEEMEYLSREATPRLVKRMYDLAMISDNLKDVVAASRFMAEYGFGRPTQKQEITVKSDVIRRGWEDMPVLDVDCD